MHKIELFYDGGCPLCKREIAYIRKRDKKQEIRFTDLDSAEITIDRYGKTHEELMAQIHARLPDGTWIIGVEVFRQLYSIIGYKWLVAFSRWPLVRQFLDFGYRIFARNRLKWTGRCKKNQCEVSSAKTK